MNLWWKHYTGAGIDFDRCSVPCDRHRTITECNFIGIVELEQQPDEMRLATLSTFLYNNCFSGFNADKLGSKTKRMFINVQINYFHLCAGHI